MDGMILFPILAVVALVGCPALWWWGLRSARKSGALERLASACRDFKFVLVTSLLADIVPLTAVEDIPKGSRVVIVAPNRCMALPRQDEDEETRLEIERSRG